MKKLFLFLLAFLFTFPAFSNCSQEELKYYSVTPDGYNQFMNNNAEAGQFHCWEIAYQIKNQLNMSVSEYSNKLMEAVKTYFPTETKSANYFRSLGDIKDIIYFSTFSKLDTGVSKDTNAAMEMVNQYILRQRLRVNNGIITNTEFSGSNIQCARNGDLQRMASIFPKLKAPVFINTNNFSIYSFSGQILGDIKINYEKPVNGTLKGEMIINNTSGYPIEWSEKCSQDSWNLIGGNLSGLLGALTSGTIITALFKTMTYVSIQTYDYFVNVAFVLLPILLMIWIFYQVLKSYNVFSQLELEERTLNMPKIFNDGFNIVIYMAFFYLIFSLLTPVELVNYIFEPILRIGLFIGEKILSVSGFGTAYDFLSAPTKTDIMFENASLYFAHYLKTIGMINGQMIILGMKMIFGFGGLGKFFTGLALVYIFWTITWEYVKMLLDLILDIITVLVFLPLYGVAWIFPESRKAAQDKTIEVFIKIAYTLATLPVFVIINTLVVKVFLTKNLTFEQIQAANLLNDNKLFTTLANDITFAEAIFIGLAISWVFNNMKGWISQMFNTQLPSGSLYKDMIATKDNAVKKFNTSKKLISDTVTKPTSASFRERYERIRNARTPGGNP